MVAKTTMLMTMTMTPRIGTMHLSATKVAPILLGGQQSEELLTHTHWNSRIAHTHVAYTRMPQTSCHIHGGAKKICAEEKRNAA